MLFFHLKESMTLCLLNLGMYKHQYQLGTAQYLNRVLKKIAANKVDQNAINWQPQNLSEDFKDLLNI